MRADLGETRAVSGPRRIRSGPGGGGGCRRGAGRRQLRRCPFVSDPRCPAPGGQGPGRSPAGLGAGRAGGRGAGGGGGVPGAAGSGGRGAGSIYRLRARRGSAAAPPRLATAVRPGRAAPADWASGGSRPSARPARRRRGPTGTGTGTARLGSARFGRTRHGPALTPRAQPRWTLSPQAKGGRDGDLLGTPTAASAPGAKHQPGRPGHRTPQDPLSLRDSEGQLPPGCHEAFCLLPPLPEHQRRDGGNNIFNFKGKKMLLYSFLLLIYFEPKSLSVQKKHLWDK